MYLLMQKIKNDSKIEYQWASKSAYWVIPVHKYLHRIGIEITLGKIYSYYKEKVKK